MPGTGNEIVRSERARSLSAIAWVGPCGETTDTTSAHAATTQAGNKWPGCWMRLPTNAPVADDSAKSAASIAMARSASGITKGFMKCTASTSSATASMTSSARGDTRIRAAIATTSTERRAAPPNVTSPATLSEALSAGAITRADASATTATTRAAARGPNRRVPASLAASMT